MDTLRKHAYAIYCNVKYCDIFLMFAQNIDCKYMLEPYL